MLRVSKATAWLDRHLYPAFSDSWDNALFRQEVLKYLRPSASILDLGAGAGILSHMNFKDHAGLVCGVDLDPRVVKNPFLHEARVADVQLLPWSSNTFDVVISNNVLEHLGQPETVFLEVVRVLKPDGMFLVKTPSNLHYVAIVARCTPYRFHRWFNRKRNRSVEDTFPTLYKANSARKIHRYAHSAGLIVERVSHIEGRPEYLRSSVPGYFAGVMYERLVNSVQVLSSFRAIIIAAMRKSAKSR